MFFNCVLYLLNILFIRQIRFIGLSAGVKFGIDFSDLLLRTRKPMARNMSRE